jgi:ArsR family transcriptional regulator, arsenate/arsenite/antimonite-responsive transcriptional repressor
MHLADFRVREYAYPRMSLLASSEVQPASGILKALADDTRLRIVALLSAGELCVCHIADALELGQPNVSQHLAVLRRARIVASRRDGNWIYCRLDLADPVRAQIVHAVLTAIVDVAGRDRKRLATRRKNVSCE